VLRSGRLALGERTRAFEAAFAAQLGVRHAVALSSCTAALHLAYLAAGVGPGDEVIVPALTFAATATAAIYCGATPVFAEIAGPHDLSLDPDDVAARITPRTKAVSVVHFGGYAAQAGRLRSLCDEHGLALVEDAAHAPSGRLGDRKLGTFGLAGCFSLFSNKVLSVGEGGLLTTDDDAVAAFARSGRAGEHGFNYRFDEPRAALALSRLGRLEADIEQRRALTRRYRERLASVPGVTIPYRDEDVAGSSCYVMPIMVEDPERQNPLRAALRERGVQTSLLYPAIHEFTAYRERFPGISLPRTELAARTEVTIPLFPHMTEAEQDRVVEGVAEEMGA
jgi:dTDP-4-amino-4,6-dideoxygalactose transaminase